MMSRFITNCSTNSIESARGGTPSSRQALLHFVTTFTADEHWLARLSIINKMYPFCALNYSTLFAPRLFFFGAYQQPALGNLFKLKTAEKHDTEPSLQRFFLLIF